MLNMLRNDPLIGKNDSKARLRNNVHNLNLQKISKFNPSLYFQITLKINNMSKLKYVTTYFYFVRNQFCTQLIQLLNC